MDAARLRGWLQTRPRGRAGALFTADVDDASQALQQACELEPAYTRVQLAWDALPALSREIEQSVEALAEATLALWPSLHTNAAQRLDAARWPRTTSTLQARDILPRSTGSPSWTRRAAEACTGGKPPIFDDMPLSEQLRQLSLALDPERLCITLLVHRYEADSASLLAFAKGAAWIARHAAAQVVAVFPHALRDHEALDSVAYDALVYEPIPDAPAAEPAAPAPPPSPEMDGSRDSHPSQRRRPQAHVWPLIGKPHPDSPPEQRLHAWLQQDAELAPLFEFNQPVETCGASRPIVDVLWRRGRLVVEIDGYREHSGRYRFGKDRHRDYELLISGYRVLRLTGTEVLRDTQATVTKIREAVRFVGGPFPAEDSQP